jgi:photosystem II stability/assembly factor-like uncharacterized protein
MVDLEKLYAEAKQELSAKHFDRASELLKQILVQDENYKDASRLLAQIIQRKRRRWYTHPLFYAGNALIVLVIIGTLVLPGILAKIRAGNSATPLVVATPQITITPETVLPTSIPTSTAAPLPFRLVRINNGQEFLRDAIVALAADPIDTDVIYVGTRSAGVYKTINGGESWQPVNTGIGNMEVKTLIIDPGNPKTLYLHNGNYIYKTSNGARTWEKLRNIEAFVMDPKDSQHLYAAAGTISETLDGGETWSPLAGAEKCGEGMTKMVVDWLDSNRLYALCSTGVYFSENGGVNWQLLKEFNYLDNIAATLLPDGQTGVVVSGNDRVGLGSLWLYKTAESKWVLKERACGTFAVDAENPASIHCDGYHSQDGGVTWPEGINWGFLWENRIRSIVLTNGKNPQIFVAGEEGGIFRSTNGGLTFSPLSKNGLPGVGYELFISPFNDSLLIIVQKDSDWRGGSSYISTNNGDTWERITKGAGLSNFSFDADGSTIYTYGMNYENLAPVLWITEDYGKTWFSQVIPGEQKSFSGIWSSPIQTGALVLYLDYPEFRLIRTWDGGQTWEKIPGPYQLDKTLQFIGYGTQVFAFNGITSTFIYSEDLFSTEQSCGFLSTPPLLIKPSLAILPDSKVVIYTMGSSGIVRSVDQCEQWESLPSQPGNIHIHSLAVDPSNPDIVYAGTSDGAYITLDAGEHWDLVTEGLLGANLIYSLGVDSKGKVLAVTPYGIFKLEGK